MVDYIVNILEDTPEDTRGESETPSAHHLFDIEENAKKLSQTNSYIFHYFVAQLLYLSKQAHPDIQPAVSLLYNKARDPENDE